jgi:hypothetical protein
MKPGVVLPESVGDSRHRHFPTQQHSQSLKKQRKTAAFASEREWQVPGQSAARYRPVANVLTGRASDDAFHHVEGDE